MRELDNNGLAERLEEVGLRLKITTIHYWTTTLRQNEVCGSHQWKNLATLFEMARYLTGQSFRAEVDYCMRQAFKGDF